MYISVSKSFMHLLRAPTGFRFKNCYLPLLLFIMYPWLLVAAWRALRQRDSCNIETNLFSIWKSCRLLLNLQIFTYIITQENFTNQKNFITVLSFLLMLVPLSFLSFSLSLSLSLSLFLSCMCSCSLCLKVWYLSGGELSRETGPQRVHEHALSHTLEGKKRRFVFYRQMGWSQTI